VEILLLSLKIILNQDLIFNVNQMLFLNYLNNMGSLGARGTEPCDRIYIKVHRNYPGIILNNILKFHGDRLDGLAVYTVQKKNTFNFINKIM
jgi:hypothetical protein